MKSAVLNWNPQRLMLVSFMITVPSIVFWCAVVYCKIFHNPKYVNALLSVGGDFSHIFFKALLPLVSLMIAIFCNKMLHQQAIAKNLWHRESPMMKVNRNLINWDVVLISMMIISLINN